MEKDLELLTILLKEISDKLDKLYIYISGTWIH